MAAADTTLPLPGVPARRGRPATGKAKSGAVRQAEFRARKRAGLEGKKLEAISVWVDEEVAEALRAYCQRKAADDVPVTMGDAVAKILRDRLLRKR